MTQLHPADGVLQGLAPPVVPQPSYLCKIKERMRFMMAGCSRFVLRFISYMERSVYQETYSMTFKEMT
jgi:hypothetical protein